MAHDHPPPPNRRLPLRPAHRRAPHLARWDFCLFCWSLRWLRTQQTGSIGLGVNVLLLKVRVTKFVIVTALPAPRNMQSRPRALTLCGRMIRGCLDSTSSPTAWCRHEPAHPHHHPRPRAGLRGGVDVGPDVGAGRGSGDWAVNARCLSPGAIVLTETTMQMLEVIVCAPLLDMVFAEKLNMEGGRTGRHVHFKVSSLRGVH